MQPHRIFRAAGVVSSATLASRILGYARDMVIAYFFGTAAAADGFESDAAGSAPPPAAAVARSETEAAGSEPAACRAAPAAAPSSADLSGIPHALFTPGRHSHCF